jgi:succinoglycan biosynthesis protein ExoM
MLTDCLFSLMEQMIDHSLFLHVVVVDNEQEPNNRELVESLALGTRDPVHYVHQPKRGIAAARNAAVEKALALGVDWIAFIDDDETADPDWIAQLMAEEYRDVPVLMGANYYVYPQPIPFWADDDGIKGYEGQPCKTAYTGNVRFSAEIVRGGLRFDERLGFMGGEDNEFFARAYAQGYAIKRTLRAITREVAHAERLTYHGQLFRAYWCAASEFRRLAITRGWLGAAVRKAHTIPVNIIVGGGPDRYFTVPCY